MADLSHEAALQRLGPALFPGEWIEGLTARETWLLKKYPRNAFSSLLPGGITLAGPGLDDAPEYGRAVRQHEFMTWQRDKARDWLDAHGIEVRERRGWRFVDGETFEAAFAAAFLQPSTPRRKGGNRAYADDAIVAKVREAVRSGAAKSLAEAARALLAEIPGSGTPEAKIERIRRKAVRPTSRPI